MTLMFRKHRAEQTEDPVGGVHFRLHTVLIKVLMEFGQMLLYQHLYYETVFLKPRKTHLVNVAQLTFFDQLNK